MTIITLECGFCDLKLADQLICYERKLSLRHLSLNYLGGDEHRLHLSISTYTATEHEFAVTTAKEIFQEIVLI